MNIVRWVINARDGKIVLLMFLMLLSYLTSFGQKELRFRHLGEAEGLTDNRYNSFVTKDSRGFVWISSLQGCYRFDGKTVKSYLLKEEINFNDNVQSAFYEDASEDLWFTTENVLLRYDRKRDAFEGQQFFKDSIKLDANYHAFHIRKRTGQLWLSAGGYMWAYNVIEKKNDSDYFRTSGKRFLVDTLGNGRINRIFAFPWFNKPGFELWNKLEGSFEKMEYHETGILKRLNISNGYVQNDSIIWLITNEGLVEYDYLNKTINKLYKPEGVNHFNLWDGLLIKKNQLLLSSNNSGLWGFDLKKKQFVKNWKHSDTDENTLQSNTPKEIYLDYENQLWITQYSNGLDYTTSSKLAFFNPLEKLGVVDVVQNIEEDALNRVWVLTRNNGIFVFNLDLKFLYHFESVEEITDFTSARLSIDSNGQPWLCNENSIYYYNGAKVLNKFGWQLACQSSKKFFNLHHPPLKEDTVFVITPTQIYYFLKSKNKTESKLVKAEIFNGHNNFDFYAFHQLNDTITYIPYGRNSIWVLKQIEQNFFIKDKIEFNALIYDALQSWNNKTIWVASNRGLFERTIGNDGSVFVKNKQIGLKDIYACVEDHSEVLWLAADDGIYSFNKVSNDLFRFTTNHGLSNNLFTEGVGILDSKGNLWFGNEKGLTTFDPSAIKPNAFSVKTYIDKAWINNKELKIETSINELSEINFPHYENTFDFSLKTIGIDQSANTTILYRLKNYDDTWASSKNGSLARFTKVPPGEYFLEAIPVDENNRRGVEKRLKIIISIPFWQTITFKVLIFTGIAFILAIGFGIHFQNQLRKQKRLVEKQKMINAERDRIGRELHDDIGGGLSSILFISEDLKHEESEKEKSLIANRISELIQSALINMKDIIWALDDDQNTLKDLLARFNSYSSSYLSDHHINLKFKSSYPQSNEVILSSKIKRNLFLILKECLHNVVKHAHAKNVSVSIFENDNIISLKIQDDGIGFDYIPGNLDGNGLENLNFRTQTIGGTLNIESAINKGTSIRLTLALP